MQLVELDISRNGKVKAQWGVGAPQPCCSQCSSTTLCTHVLEEAVPFHSPAECSRGSGAKKICLSYCVLGCHQYLVSHFPHDRLFSSLFFSFMYFFQTFQKFLKASNSANPWKSQTSVGILSPGRKAYATFCPAEYES